MHLKKEVNQNRPGQCDPRLRHYYVYTCSVCGHEQDFNWVPNFDTIRLRKCSSCGVTDDSNNQEFLLRQQQTLEQEISSLEASLKQKRQALMETIAQLSPQNFEQKQQIQKEPV